MHVRKRAPRRRERLRTGREPRLLLSALRLLSTRAGLLLPATAFGWNELLRSTASARVRLGTTATSARVRTTAATPGFRAFSLARSPLQFREALLEIRDQIVRIFQSDVEA